MAPLARPALLAVLLLTPALLRAQTEQDVRDKIAALKTHYADAAQKMPALPAPVESAPVDPAKLEASKAVVANAGIDPQKLGWAPLNVADLGPAITAASAAVKKLHDDNKSAVGDTFYGNGTMVNLEQSIGAATKLWPSNDFRRGCVAHQGATFPVVSAALKNSSLEARRVIVHRGIFEHHAVIVFPKGSDWKTGVVLDGWIHQESAPDRMTFRFKDWNGLTSWGAALEE